MKFGVVVSVPEGEEVAGNLAVPTSGVWVARDPRDPMRVEPVGPHMLLALRVPVFAMGEILVLDESGREIAGPMRKPSKWSVGVELFDTIELAVARAKALALASEG